MVGSAAAVHFAERVSEMTISETFLVICQNKKEALFFVSDLYNFFDESRVFLLPEVVAERSRESIKTATEKVQRTAAVEALLRGKHQLPVIVVSYPEALAQKILAPSKASEVILSLKVGEHISRDFMRDILFQENFHKVDFVSVPGEFALRGSIIDIFSFNDNTPVRIDFFDDEVESIGKFDSETQRTVESVEEIKIYPDITEKSDNNEYIPLEECIPDNVKRVDIEKYFIENCPGIIPQPTFNKNFDILYDDIFNKENEGYKIYILSTNLNQNIRLRQIIEEKGGEIHPEFLTISLHEGYVDKINKICRYTDHQIFERYHKIIQKREVKRSERLTINELSAFNIGDYVVHINHGVGRFGGLVRTNVNGKMQEAVKIMYAEGDVIFVSIHNIHRISRYKSKDAEPPKIYRLGSRAWENLKERTKSKVKDIASDLIKLYGERQQTRGYAFSDDNMLMSELESSFMYEDTADQHKAIEAVKADMESVHPMDRLVCGDVGFGKTEVAIRAAFKAVCDCKQVAVLVPTTVLALQHYYTFLGRLKDFSVNVEFLSRLKTAKETKKIQEDVSTGKIDILIGTHRILGKGIKFKDLGLLIIDEEQKFGVQAKEKLRQLKTNIDTLTLTATPIPRTLQFSLLGARDLSIINTPPPNRLPVYTEIIEHNEEQIKEIIDAEIERGGQLFYIHNRINDINEVEGMIHRICPEARVVVGHGQMDAAELEKRILDFVDGNYDVLLCTTIVENGIDIPNANTIIIDRANAISLSDLHQLRGRVGRSNVKAYCYLMINNEDSITDDARRRLNAIETFSDLGSGFNIAMQDLDIRGAGNLLGAEQSGFIADMGFETYQKILNEALAELNYEHQEEVGESENTPEEEKVYLADCHIETDMEVLIPDTYIDMTAEKIRLYKELDSMTTEEELSGFREEISDRFGPIPPELEELMNIVRLRGLAIHLGMERIVLKNRIMKCFFIGESTSKFYDSSSFRHIMQYVQNVGRTKKFQFEMPTATKKFSLTCEGVNSVEKAVTILREMLPLQDNA